MQTWAHHEPFSPKKLNCESGETATAMQPNDVKPIIHESEEIGNDLNRQGQSAAPDSNLSRCQFGGCRGQPFGWDGESILKRSF